MKRILLALLALSLALVGPSAADAAKKHKPKNHTITATVRTVTISSTGSPPASGSDTYAGTVASNLGAGATTGSNQYPTPGSFTGTFTTFVRNGSVSGSLAGTGKINPDGSISFSGTGKFVSGTGTYKGGKGTFTFTGTQPKDSNVVTFTITGTAKY